MISLDARQLIHREMLALIERQGKCEHKRPSGVASAKLYYEARLWVCQKCLLMGLTAKQWGVPEIR